MIPPHMGSSDPPGGRQNLIDATLTCLGRYGYHRSSVRRIAECAGVTAGLLRHYFSGKNELLAEAYGQFQRNALEAHLEAAERTGPDPTRRLRAFIGSILGAHTADRAFMNLWVSFLESVVTDPVIAAAHAEVYDQYIERLSGWITEIHTARGETLTAGETRSLAVASKSMIDGVWLECSLNPSRMTDGEALGIALDVIGSRLGVSLAHLPDGSA